MIKNLSTKNGVVEIERLNGTVIEVAADLACVVDAVFSAMIEEDTESKEIVKKLFIEAVEMPFKEHTAPLKKQEEKSDDPADAAFMAFLAMLMSDDKRPVS